MAKLELRVYLDGVAAGTIRQDANGRTTFAYDDDYVASPDAYPLSLSLPFGSSEYGPKQIGAYLWGLLPENEIALERIARRYQISARNPVAILAEIGRDTAGAVQILRPDEQPRDAGKRTELLETLDEVEFRLLMVELSRRTSDWSPALALGRWSLAGAQNKVALFRRPDGRWAVPMDSTPTTHILKPGIDGFEGHAVNEHLSGLAAKKLGIATATSEIISVEGVGPVLISTRFDRRKVDGVWRRLHQEDMCQALSVLPGNKYQADGGPGVADMADVIGTFDARDRAASVSRFFDAIVFNTAMAGTDAHAKNYGVLIAREGRLALAPLYDLATSTPYRFEGPLRSPVSVGGEWSFTKIGRTHLRAAARRIGVDADRADARIDEIRGGIAAAYAAAAAELVDPTIRATGTTIANAVKAYAESREF